MKSRVSLVLFIIIVLQLGCKLPYTRSRSLSVSRPESRSSDNLLPVDTISLPTITLTPSPAPVFREFGIYGVDWLPSGDLLITLETIEMIVDEYYLMQSDIKFNCRVSLDSDKILFCVGVDVPQGRSVPISIFQEEDDLLVFEGTINIPDKPGSSGSSGGGNGTDFPTSLPGSTPTVGPTSPPP